MNSSQVNESIERLGRYIEATERQIDIDIEETRIFMKRRLQDSISKMLKKSKRNS